ncbi:hypothetical protein KL86CLO1_12856 [uncultured Eubacteriales bacterium]|uniref:Uncharacterized protein n=1 Tax=uncultured Eubacteriales bacterium TaxID=172733 RepID=A0A212KER0_9FIRM|nr:hypothetical protein KL86CLO1_12856 [uncultured Eubacteriales bacterium]
MENKSDSIIAKEALYDFAEQLSKNKVEMGVKLIALPHGDVAALIKLETLEEKTAKAATGDVFIYINLNHCPDLAHSEAISRGYKVEEDHIVTEADDRDISISQLYDKVSRSDILIVATVADLMDGDDIDSMLEVLENLEAMGVTIYSYLEGEHDLDFYIEAAKFTATICKIRDGYNIY